MNRIEAYAATVREVINGNTPEKLAIADKGLALTFQEHYAYQNAQAMAFVGGKLNQDEAMTVYTALGEVGSAANGGWARGTDLATKIAVTQLMGTLMGAPQRG